eukprot:Skav223383  [mRNA]  locus=scaffold2634:294385:297693:+ [translate_table: standard]
MAEYRSLLRLKGCERYAPFDARGTMLDQEQTMDHPLEDRWESVGGAVGELPEGTRATVPDAAACTDSRPHRFLWKGPAAAG